MLLANEMGITNLEAKEDNTSSNWYSSTATSLLRELYHNSDDQLSHKASTSKAIHNQTND